MKITVGMSGGIDSAVTAYLLKKEGHEVTAVTMSVCSSVVPEGASGGDYCFSPDKTKVLSKSREICKKLDIQHIVVDCSKEFDKNIMDYFQKEYLAGRTPNPCVMCNSKIKFQSLWDKYLETNHDFDYFATGHYAKIHKIDGRYCLGKARDPKKDQSYFLYRLTQDQLSKIVFPLGNYTKEEVKVIDQELGFHRKNQSESQDFYSGHYSDLLGVKSTSGNIVDTSGKILGKHDGIWNYTIGQRKGLGIAHPRPLYVLRLLPETNEVVVGEEEETYSDTVIADNLNWVSVPRIEGEIEVMGCIRSTDKGKPAVASITEDGNLKVVFKNKVKAVTSGQSLVIYKDNLILCGGFIK